MENTTTNPPRAAGQAAQLWSIQLYDRGQTMDIMRGDRAVARIFRDEGLAYGHPQEQRDLAVFICEACNALEEVRA